MKTLRVTSQGLCLVCSDVLGIAGGAMVAHAVTGQANQIHLQLPIAAFLSLALFLGGNGFLRALKLRSLQLGGKFEFMAAFAVSLVLAPALFVPLHFLTQGYLTSPANLVGLAIYQVPINALALFGWWLLCHSRSVRPA